jgi:hypothetical protein
MTQYVGCEQARTLLDGLIDGELSMPDQLAVESHLRWCDTCALRVTDMRVIGASLRVGSSALPFADADDNTLTAITEGLVVRVRAERDESFASRFREMVTDRRFLWPTLGATAAVLLCITAAGSVLRASIDRDPDSLAAMIASVGSPGTEQWPLRPANNGISIPRLVDDEAEHARGMLEQMPEDDMIVAVRTVIGRDGTVAGSEFLASDDMSAPYRDTVARAAAQEMAVLDAVRKTRFVPAHNPVGQAVAVDVVWVLAKMTVAAPLPPLRTRPVEPVRAVAKPEPVTPAAPPLSSQPLPPSATV